MKPLINFQLVVASFFLFESGVSLNNHVLRGKRLTKRSPLEWNEPVAADQWFEQILDHFDVVSNATWQQRFFTNDSSFQGDGPVFLLISGETKASPIDMQSGMWIEWAKKFKALCFQLEHRYYGESQPTQDMSTKNLKFLSSEQALADLAYFIQSKKTEFKLKNNKWILFGCSYPGSLAAWFRLKYPHLAHGAVASSAPLLAQINFKEYLGVVTDALISTSQGFECTDAIEEAVVALEEEIQSDECCETTTQSFKLCSDLDRKNELDLANFFKTLAHYFQKVVQFDFEIDVVCNVMTNKTIGSPLARYSLVNSNFLNFIKEDCLDYTYDESIKSLQRTEWNSSTNDRQWTYQTCTEFGYFQSSDLERQPFGKRFPVEFEVRQCGDIFGPEYNYDLLKNAVDRTNNFYGGLNLKVDRVVFPNGSMDPWHALGITDNSTGNTAILIQGTSHCTDTFAPSEGDSAELVQARKIIENHLSSWLQG